MVAVLSKTGMKLMPTSEYKARRLLRKGKASIEKHKPFTIRLEEREGGAVQPVAVCMDTGYQHIGVSVKSKKHEYLSLQIDTLKDEKERHDSRRMYRRQRRSRLRYRAPRFDNRRREEGWLAPSLKHKPEIHLQVLTKICAVFPVTSITMEMGQFDTQLLKAVEEGRPAPEGTDYQYGERYGIATLREAVFTRDHYTCQCCGRTIKDNAILHAHHIRYRSQGGTDRMGNLITVCEKCHTPANHKPGGKLYGWEPKVKSFKGATYMTAVRWILYGMVKSSIPDVEIRLTYGASTKIRRRMLDIKKSHANDAFVMGVFHPRHRSRTQAYQKKRRNNRVLEKFYDAKYIDTRTGKKQSGQQLFNGRISRNRKKDSENLHKYRGKKLSAGKRTIRTKHYKFQPHDTVWYQGGRYEIAGCHNNGTRVIILTVDSLTGKSCRKSVSIKQVKHAKYAGGYYKTEQSIYRKESAG